MVAKEEGSDNLCEPIIIDRNYIGEREKNTKAKKKHFEYFNTFVAKLNDEKKMESIQGG